MIRQQTAAALGRGLDGPKPWRDDSLDQGEMAGERGVMAQLLLVEADPVVARRIAYELTRHGQDVTVAYSCAEAMALVRRFDLGVFDASLVDGSGIGLAARLGGLGRVARRLFFNAGAGGPLLKRAKQMGNVLLESEGIPVLVEQALALVREPLREVDASGPRD